MKFDVIRRISPEKKERWDSLTPTKQSPTANRVKIANLSQDTILNKTLEMVQDRSASQVDNNRKYLQNGLHIGWPKQSQRDVDKPYRSRGNKIIIQRDKNRDKKHSVRASQREDIRMYLRRLGEENASSENDMIGGENDMIAAPNLKQSETDMNSKPQP